VNIYIQIGIWTGLILAAFIVSWRAGYVAQLSAYVQGTRDELKKCTWPTWEELKGSTVVVAVSIALLGMFTMFADFIFNWVVARFI